MLVHQLSEKFENNFISLMMTTENIPLASSSRVFGLTFRVIQLGFGLLSSNFEALN